MNYGISMEIINLNYQEPNRNRRESKYFWDEFYTLVAAAGFNTVEIPYEPKWDYGGRSGIPLTARSVNIKFGSVPKYLESLAQAGIKKLSGVHLDPSLFIGSNLDMYFGAFSHYAKEAIVFAQAGGADYVTLTPSPSVSALQSICPPDTAWPEFSDSFISRTIETIDALADFAAQNSIKLCLKNEYWTLFRGERIFNAINELQNKVLWDADTAHLHIAGVDPVRLISENIKKVGCVHLTDTAISDTEGYFSKPLPEFPVNRPTQVFRDLGHGNVDLPAICACLKAADYSGSVICNSRQTRDPYRTLLRTRSYINTKLSSQI